MGIKNNRWEYLTGIGQQFRFLYSYCLKRTDKGGILITAFFLVVNLVQAVCTPLINDESYYWVYSQNLAWGYFDHPPMIALFIQLSSFFFKGELGLRFASVLAGAATVFIGYKIMKEEADAPVNLPHAFLLIACGILLNLFTFLALPDTPLLFFAALFFWQIRASIHKPRALQVLALAIAAAGMLYSKYHGVLIIGFTVVAYPLLLKKKWFYVAMLAALALFIPHLYWLAGNDFMTLRYHLFERSSPAFAPEFSLHYIGEQAALTGPLFILVFSMLYKPRNAFQRILQFNVAGVFIFFLLSSFKTLVNAHWTSVAWLPMIILCFLYFSEKKIIQLPFKVLLLFNLVFVLVARSALVVNCVKVPGFSERNLKVMAEKITAAAGGVPPVFINTFNEPSAYMFYTAQKSFAINETGYKRTQFNFWERYERDIQHKNVVIVSEQNSNGEGKEVAVPLGRTYYLFPVADYRSYFTTIQAEALNLPRSAKAGDLFNLKYKVHHTLNDAEEKEWKQSPDFNLMFCFYPHKGGAAHQLQCAADFVNGNTQELPVAFPNEPGIYKCFFSVTRANHPYVNGFNSRIYFVEVK